MNDIVGVLACLKLLANDDDRLEERYANLISSIEQQDLDADLADLKKAL